MSEIKEQLAILVVLQEKDSALDALKNDAAARPEAIEAMRAEDAALKAAASEKKKALIQYQMQRKEKELELDAKESAIRKHTAELNSVKSNDAYKALLSEIEKAKQGKSLLENEILDLMEKIESESVRIKGVEAETKQQDAAMQAKIAVLENEYKALQEKVAAAEQDRADFVKQVPADMLRQYEFLRESREGKAMAAIVGETCGGCNMQLRPQAINDVVKGKDFVTCDMCSRILYHVPEKK